ncbi:hypothetical protein ACTHPH_21800 [Paenibacillus pasadenensis]|uniref:hypothetical protein n=1 Tax=Paenibacillus pasadenensis TaxID=217090 RepID=UPI000490E356|nr:hypothetical protein [Paenibacillus pasadenensis]
MYEFSMTGFLDNSYKKKTTLGNVLNFYLRGDGYQKDSGKYEPIEHMFETWVPDVIDVVEKTPKGSVVTVTFNLFPKKVRIEGGITGRYESLRAVSVRVWDKALRKETPKKGENATQLAFDQLPYE